MSELEVLKIDKMSFKVMEEIADDVSGIYPVTNIMTLKTLI